MIDKKHYVIDFNQITYNFVISVQYELALKCLAYISGENRRNVCNCGVNSIIFITNAELK